MSERITPEKVSNQQQVVSLTLGSRADEMMPTLSDEQIARISTHGRIRKVERDEILVEPGQPASHFFVVVSGQIQLVRPSETQEELIGTYGRGMFTGEVNMLSGRRGF